jgi:hypothetical protein
MKTILYDVMVKDYRNRRTFRIGSVPERRRMDRTGGKPDLAGGLRYARQVFGDLAKDPNAVFIIPKEAV